MTKPKTKQIVNCLDCGKSFLASRKSHVLCSRLCNDRYWMKNNRDKHNKRCRETHQRLYGHSPKPTEEIHCDGCGKLFLPDRENNKCCSLSCAEKRRRKLDPTRAKKKVATEIRIHQEKPWMPLLYGAKQRAKDDGLPFSLTKEWMESRWTGRCELTGIQFRGGRGKGPSTIFSASIDKIVPSLGYVPENCRLILKGVNWLKGNGTDDQMYEIAFALIQYTATTSHYMRQSVDRAECIGHSDEQTDQTDQDKTSLYLSLAIQGMLGAP